MTEPKRGFEVGERVAVYSSSGREVGTVCGPDAFGYSVRVRGTLLFFHTKQLRRLKPKPKPKPKAESKPREWWIHTHSCSHPRINSFPPPGKWVCPTYGCEGEILHVTELPAGSAVVSRESLAKAFGSVGIRMHLYQDAHDECFEVLCKALGLSPEGKVGMDERPICL